MFPRQIGCPDNQGKHGQQPLRLQSSTEHCLQGGWLATGQHEQHGRHGRQGVRKALSADVQHFSCGGIGQRASRQSGIAHCRHSGSVDLGQQEQHGRLKSIGGISERGFTNRQVVAMH